MILTTTNLMLLLVIRSLDSRFSNSLAARQNYYIIFFIAVTWNNHENITN